MAGIGVQVVGVGGEDMKKNVVLLSFAINILKEYMEEGKLLDKKSLRFLKGKNTDWDELTKDCISFANSHGGNIIIGIEDCDDLPPLNQKITDKSILEIIHKKISEKSINVIVSVTLEIASNKAEYIRIYVPRNVNSLASTTDGKYYVRIADVCKPVMPEDIARVAADKNAFVWEKLTSMRVEKSKVDEKKKAIFLHDVRTSLRVSAFVKEKSGDGKGSQYAVSPKFSQLNRVRKTNTGRKISDTYLEEIISKDIMAHPNSSVSEIHARINNEINLFKLKRMLGAMLDRGILSSEGIRKMTKYSIKQNMREKP
jgi:predicted HTH transcriptional regulator